MRQRKKPIGHKKFEEYNAFSSSEESWRSKAKCKDQDTQIFFAPSKSLEARKALTICASCPVVNECFYNSLIYQYQGIWGGFTEEVRSKILSMYLNNDLSDFTVEKAALIRKEFDPVFIKK